jgi:DNA polymerase-3 subunit epsilon
VASRALAGVWIFLSNFPGHLSNPMQETFSIVDIETTGSGIRGNKITEIAIFRIEGGIVAREFTSLVNPECEIPYYITALTGIDNSLVRNAPLLREIAPEILDITRDSIFVAHSVNFDYHVLKNELSELGIEFRRKRLCTVRLARRLFPGLHSYSLGKLCTALDIALTDRHRARGDARATVVLFRKIMDCETSGDLIKSFLNARSQEATLPPGLPRNAYEKLPVKPGIYYFKNARGQVIYVGKAKNIKKRVLSHFYDQSDKEVRMCRETSDIDFEISGSELLALLMETAAIKQLYPEHNRAQKKYYPRYGIFSYEDRKGIIHLGYSRAKNTPQPLTYFYTVTECRLYLEQLCRDFGLCPKYCHLQEQAAGCNHFRIPGCGGICRGSESVAGYNTRVMEAITSVNTDKEDYFVKEKGRNAEEACIILVIEGRYCGFGFVEKDRQLMHLEDIMSIISPQKNTLETERLLKSYSLRNPGNIVMLTGEEVRSSQ